MTTTQIAHITIDLDDVLSTDGQTVREAIMEWCKRSDDTSCGIIGPAFSTSGPGPGWSRRHDVNDFAQRAVQGGARYYVDENDGRMIEAEEVEDDERDENGEWPEDVIHDLGGGHSRLGDWSDESVVCVECPSVDDALEHPTIVAEMAQAVIDYHGACSDRQAWAALLTRIRSAAEALDDIDIDALRGE